MATEGMFVGIIRWSYKKFKERKKELEQLIISGQNIVCIEYIQSFFF